MPTQNRKHLKTRLSSERGRPARVNPPILRTSRPRSFAVEATVNGLYRAGDVAAGKQEFSPLAAARGTPGCAGGLPKRASISPLRRPVTSLWGVGAERAAQLARLDIHTVEDLLLHRPRRYEDRRHFRKIAELTKDEPATARGTIVALGLKRFRGGSKSVFEIILDDGTARLHCRWWNLPFMEKYFAVGDEVFVFGKLRETKPRTMDHPETEVIEGGEESFIHINRIAPVYPLTEGLPQRWLRGLIWRTLEKFERQIAEPASSRVPHVCRQNLRRSAGRRPLPTFRRARMPSA